MHSRGTSDAVIFQREVALRPPIGIAALARNLGEVVPRRAFGTSGLPVETALDEPAVRAEAVEPHGQVERRAADFHRCALMERRARDQAAGPLHVRFVV